MARLSVVFLLAALSLLGAATLKPEPIRLIVSPRAAIAPVDLLVTVRVTPASQNRQVTVSMDGEQFYRSSAWTLDGDSAPAVFSVSWRSVPAGDYFVRAELMAAGGRFWQTAVPVSYLSRGF